MSVAKSLTEVVKILRKGEKVQSLVLRQSKDLVCNNLFCEKVTGPCICRLERTIQDIDAHALETMDLSGNNLTALPPSMATLENLKELDISNNEFQSKPEILLSLKNLVNLKDDTNPYRCK
jgi:Leucine-rich repeat (LRR) protein